MEKGGSLFVRLGERRRLKITTKVVVKINNSIRTCGEQRQAGKTSGDGCFSACLFSFYLSRLFTGGKDYV